MQTSIIIVNWNSIDYLRECVASIHRHTKSSFEIIVVDNASPAGDGALLEQEVLGITLIKSPENLGFAGANNLGFKHSTGKHLLFLNPDTKLVGPAIDLMLKAFETARHGGILGCRLLNEDLSTQTSCIQTFPTIMNQLLDADWLRLRFPNSQLWGTWPLQSNGDIPIEVEVISGACMLMRREVFEQISLFTEDYFMYAEDLDLCYKALQKGYVNYFLGSANLIHYGGKSSNFKSATRMKWESIVRFCEKHHGTQYALIFRLVLALAAIARLVTIAGIGLFRTPFKTPPWKRPAFIKWRIILGVLLSAPKRSPRSKNIQSTVPECGTSRI